MQLFYSPDIKLGGSSFLNETESKHAIRVLRLGENSHLYISNGDGSIYKAKIIAANVKKCEILVEGLYSKPNDKPFHLHIAIAPTKNIDRFEFFLEKSTEIGIDEITPLKCLKSERKHVNLERLRKVLIASMKQSLNAKIPVLNEVTEFNNVLSNSGTYDLKLIAHCEEQPREDLFNVFKPASKIIVLIGPEGDFSTTEIGLSKEHGFKGTSLGNSRLRTETAGIVACYALHTLSISAAK